MRLKLLLIAVALFVGFGATYGQGSENFLNIPASSTNYNARSWTGTDGVTWGATLARTDQTITGKAICTNGSGTVTSPTYAGGIGTLSFNYVRAFTGTNARSIQVWVNGVQIGSTITVSPLTDVVVNYSQAINITGNVVLELRTSGAQIKIDDISWTGYADTPTQLVLVNVPSTGTTGTPLSSFTVEGRNAGGTVVPSFTGLVTLTKASGTGSINGTLTANAVAGVATFNNVAFDQASTCTITATSTGLTSATSGNVIISNPSTNIFGGDGVNFVGQINAYSQPTNCTYGDYRVLQYRKVNTTAVAPTDGRGQWVTTVNVQASGGNVTPLNMSGGSSAGFLFTSGGGCGATGNYTNKWAFGGVGQGSVDAINGSTYNGSTDMGFNMNTVGRYTFVLKDNGYNGTGYYVGYTTNAPVTITHNTGSQRTLNNDGTTTITATISATNSSQENFYVRYKTGSNDFSTGTSTISAAGTVASTNVTLTIPVQADGATVYYYIFSSTMSQSAIAALSEGDKSYALLNYADNSGNNYSYTALSLMPTVTSIVPTAITGVTGQANNTGFKGQTMTVNGTNFQSNSTVTINGVAATSVTFISASQLTAVVANTGVNFTGNVVVANPTPVTSVTIPSFNFLGYISSGTGAINTASNWLGGSVPLANSTVTITHVMTHATGATTGTPFASLTIPSGGSLAVGSTGAVAVTTAISISGTGILSFTVSTATVSAGSISNAGTLSWIQAGTLTINTGGSFTNTGAVTSGAVGNVVFAGTGTINGGTPIAFNNLTINGTTTLTTAPTITGTLQINSGGNVTAAPTYDSASTLVYNTTGTYGVSNEWTGNGTTAGAGIPKNVTIQNNTTLTMPNSSRGLAGNLSINSGNLTLNATSGDLYLTGNWTRASTASFTPNNRAVFFNGNITQTLTVSGGGTEIFNYLFVAGSGTLRPATGTAINVTASSGLSLSSTHATSTIDLNGQTLTLSGGGNLNLSGGNRFITSNVAGGIFKIGASTTSIINPGTLTLDNKTTLLLDNGSFDCGTGAATTINGILQINANGYITGNTPRYGVFSLLKYNSGGTYNRNFEWNGTTVPVGVPDNVLISNGTTLNYFNSANLGEQKIIYDLTIDAGSGLNMGSVSCGGPLNVGHDVISSGTLTLGFANGDDLKIGGDIILTTGYSFNTNDRAIFFTKNGTQKITASSTPTFNKILFTPASGTTTVQLGLSTSLNITTPSAGGDSIDFGTAANVFDINGNTLTLGTAGRSNTIIGANGTFKGSISSNLALLGTGSLGTLKFANNLNLGTLTMNRQAAVVGCTLGSAVTINTALNLTNGLISLGNFDISLGLTATNTGSANGFVISDPDVGTGMLIKKINAFGAYTLHIGENTLPNGAQYAPATINFSSGTFSAQAYYGVQVKDAIHPNIDSPIDSLSKYWIITSSGTFTTPIYSFTGLYTAGTADVNGTESNCISARWDGTKWTNGTAIGGGFLTISGLTTMVPSTTNEISAGNRNREINIKGLTGGTNNILSGSPTANGLNNTLFAQTSIGGTPATKDYEIQNLGIAALNLTGTPLVSIGGDNPGDFTVSTVPATPIIGGASTSFIITFAPTYAGIRTAIVSIANNDSNENPYTFLIQGTGICSTITNTITPTSGPVGTEITINSAANLTGATVTLSGIAATVIPVSANQIKVLVPTGATSGNLITTFVATGCQTTNYFTVVNNLNTSCQGGNGASDLFISEVTDANWGGLTYVEIYNGTGVSKSLSGYSINTASNGNAYSGTPLNLSNVTLASGSTYVVAFGDDDLCTSLGGDGSLAVQSTANLGVNFKPNENDHIALFNGATKIDSWGTFGSDNWATSSLSIFATETNGATFRRKNTALTLPSTTYANADWEIIDFIGNTYADCGNNDYSNIGTYNFIAGTPPSVTTHPSYTPTCKATSLTVAGTEGYNGTSPADSKELTYRWLFSAPNETGWNEIINDGGIYTGTTTATLNISNIATVLNYQYYCQIRENTNTCYAASNAVKITDGETTTWNGSWTNGTPTLDKLVIISANYDTSSPGLGSFDACSVVVNSGKTLTITPNEYIKIQNDLTVNGVLTIENSGSLVQVNDSGSNTGNITYKSNTTAGEFDYTYWSSPVVGQTLLAVSPFTESNKFFSFNAVTNDWLQEDTSNTMTIGKGYIIRGIAPPPSPAIPPGFYTAPFFGKPNNGIINVPINWNGDLIGTSNLIGNPYPSAMDADNFLDTNAGVIEGTLYFWTHNTDLQLRADIIANGATPGTGAQAYTSDDYASYNLLGGVGTSMAPSGSTGGVNTNVPNGKIAAGQAFFTTSLLANGNVIFNNSMRLSSAPIPAVLDNSQFFKTRNPKTKSTTFEKHRIWLNLTNTQGAFKQTLVGYITDATNQYDNRFDGETFDGNEFVDFYSINQEKNLVIQGRALPFDENDQVPLGFRTTINGDFTIKIDQTDGVLTNQAVFIEDKLTNTIFDLRSGPFTFNTAAGTFNDRFVLRYTDKTLGTIDLETGDNQVLVSNKNKQIKVNSKVEPIDKVVVYDLLGRLLFKKDKVNSNELSILHLISNAQTLLVKVTLQNGQTITKKIIF